MVRIVVLDGRPLAAERADWAALERLGQLELYDHTPPDLVAARTAGADILVTNKAPVTAELLESAARPRFVTVTATGFDCVDVAAARRVGVPVSNVPEYGTSSVAQYVFALLLELCHHVAVHDAAVRAGEWTAQPDFCLRKTPLVDLEGKTMGIVGYGRIGRRVGQIARGFGMRVVLHTRHRPAGPEADDWRTLDDLFAESDVVSLHCPMQPGMAPIVTAARLSRMKSSAFLINTARGGLVAERDLADALAQGKLGGAAVDVVSVEPIPADHPLLVAPRCLITPHIAWASTEARARLMQATAANIEAFLAGQPIHLVT